MTFVQSATLFTFALILQANQYAGAFQSVEPVGVVQLIDNSEFRAKLQSIDGANATFIQAGDAKIISVDRLNSIRFSEAMTDHESARFLIVHADGTQVHSKAVTLSDRQLVCTTEAGTELQVGTRLVDHIRFSSKMESQWQKIITSVRESDALVVNRDGNLQLVEGIIGDFDDKTVSFSVGERTAEIQLSRLSGMLFYRRIAKSFDGPQFALTLTNGSTIKTLSLTAKDGMYEVRSVAGADFLLSPESVANIDFKLNRSVWLTDLEPASNEWEPLIASSRLLPSLKKFSLAKIDKSFSGKPLSIFENVDDGGSRKLQAYKKGFAIKGGGKLSFLLAKQFKRLTGKVAFDPDANVAGVAKLLIQIDGKTRVDRILDASAIDEPFLLDVNLNGAERIVFQLNYHDRRSVGDIVHAVGMQLER